MVTCKPADNTFGLQNSDRRIGKSRKELNILREGLITLQETLASQQTQAPLETVHIKPDRRLSGEMIS